MIAIAQSTASVLSQLYQQLSSSIFAAALADLMNMLRTMSLEQVVLLFLGISLTIKGLKDDPRWIKHGFMFVVLALAWNNVTWLYSEAVAATGSPFIALLIIIVGGMCGLEFAVMLLKKLKGEA